jgi:hypothetical protein
MSETIRAAGSLHHAASRAISRTGNARHQRAGMLGLERCEEPSVVMRVVWDFTDRPQPPPATGGASFLVRAKRIPQ